MGARLERFFDGLERFLFQPQQYTRPGNAERRKSYVAWLREEAAKRPHPNADETFTEAAVRYMLEAIPLYQSYAYVEFWCKDGWRSDHILKAAKQLKMRGYDVQVKYSPLGALPSTDRIALKVLL